MIRENVTAERLAIGNTVLQNIMFENLTINELSAFALFGKGLAGGE